VLPGGLGTLEELLEIWTAKHLGMHVKPVVVLDPDGLFAPLRDQLDLMLERRFVTPESLDEVIWADSVTSAVAVFGGAVRPA
jgi:predicted Rossmann-fold nucleotide-binding protein